MNNAQKIRIERARCRRQGKGRKRPVAEQAGVEVLRLSKKIVGAGGNRRKVAVWARESARRLVAILGAIGLSVHPDTLLVLYVSRTLCTLQILSTAWQLTGPRARNSNFQKH